jgi:hypothetical protein
MAVLNKTDDDRQIVAADGWGIATDGNQWVLQRLRGHQWANLSFVRSTKNILARCMTEKGVPSGTAKQLLAALGDTFDPAQKGPELTVALSS